MKRSFLENRNWHWFLLGLLAILVCASFLSALGAHAYIGFFTRYLADDYCYAEVAHSEGFLAAQRVWYTEWTGRVVSTFAISLAGIAGPRVVPYLPSVVLVLWTLALSWSIWQFARMIGLRRPFIASILLAGIIIVGTTYTTPNIVQSLYWQTGMLSYTAPLLFLVAYIGFVAYASRRWPFRTTPSSLILSVALPLVAGGFSETYVAAQTGGLFLAVVLGLLLKRGSFRPTTFRLILGGFVGSTLALAVMILAPGNVTRGAVASPSLSGALSIIVLSVYHALRFVRISVLASPFVITLSAVGPAFLAFTLQSQKDLARSLDRPKWSAMWMLILPPILGFIVIAFSFAPAVYAFSFPPVPYGASSLPPLRAWIVPQFILVCALVFWGIAVGLTLRARGAPNRNPSARALIFASALIIALLALGPLASARRILSLAPQVRAYASRWDDRDREMRDAKLKGKQDLTVPALGYTGGLQDLYPDPKQFPNDCVARYYGLDSVIAERPSTEDFPVWLRESNSPFWLKGGK